MTETYLDFSAAPKRNDFARSFLSKKFHYALVGASNDPAKYGNIVFRDLRDGGFMVTPVNPNAEAIERIPAVPRLQDVKPTPDVAVVVVPPKVGLTIVSDAHDAGVRRLWFQPGAESEDIRRAAAQWKIDIMADGSCIMVARRVLPI